MGLLQHKFGVYGKKDRKLQKMLSWEHTGLSWQTARVYKYLGSRASDDPSLDDIQLIVFNETPDRAYASDPIEINIDYEAMQAAPYDIGQLGLIGHPLGETHRFKVHVNSFEEDGLGRMLVKGDVLEIPFLKYESLHGEDKSYWEVTDVDPKPSFENFYIVASAIPLQDKRQTAEIPDKPSNRGFIDELADNLKEDANEEVSKEGLDAENVETESSKEREKIDTRRKPQRSFLDSPGEIDD